MAKRRYHSARLIEKKKKKRIIFGSLGVILFILFITGLSYVANHNAFNIEEIEINELRFVDIEEIDSLVKENISGKYLWLFSKSNSVIFPRSRTERTIREKYHSVKRVDTDFRGFHKIRVNIIEHDPVARWCDVTVETLPEPEHEGIETSVAETSVIPDTTSEKGDANCYFLNEDGLVFVEEPELHTGTYVTFFGLIDLKEGESPLGKSFGAEEKYRELISLTKLIRRLDISSEEIWTKTGEVYTVVTKSGAKLHVDNEDEAVSIFRNLETVIEQDAINRAQFKNIDYIDLRFGNRVFYRLK